MRAKTTHTIVSNKTEAEYTYFPSGHPRRLVLGSPKAQGVNFRYNSRDWLIHINNQKLSQSTPSQDNNDRYGLVIGYDKVAHIGSAQGAQAQYNGNISWLMYAMHGVNFTGPDGTTRLVGYSFAYDKANRVLKGEFGYYSNGAWRQTNAYDEKDITYHNNCNITALKRYNQSGNLLHNYTYNYYEDTNRLRRVTGSGNNYAYDNNGNMIQDLANGIGFVIYDIHNLPVRVFTTQGAPRDYAYDHNGNRVRKYNGIETNYYINGIDGRTEVVTDKASSWATYNLYGLDLIGQIRRTGSTWNRFYFLKDHLGSVRVTVNASGTVVSYDDYYPFGALMYGRTQDSSSVDGRYKFTGKERDAETKYDYFGARYYDARIGRFLSADPLSDDERLIGWSPYHYGYNNPVRFVDIRGMQPEENDEEDRLRKYSQQLKEQSEKFQEIAKENIKGSITFIVGTGIGGSLKGKLGPIKLNLDLVLKEFSAYINPEYGIATKESTSGGIKLSFKEKAAAGIHSESYRITEPSGTIREDIATTTIVSTNLKSTQPFAIGTSNFSIGGSVKLPLIKLGGNVDVEAIYKSSAYYAGSVVLSTGSRVLDLYLALIKSGAPPK